MHRPTSRLNVVNPGLPQTGTTTLARALRAAGLYSADQNVRSCDTRDHNIRDTFDGFNIHADGYETGDPLARLGFYDALTEISALRPPVALFPQCDYPVLKAMRDHHPAVTFVATTRPAESVCDSMDQWRDMGTRLDAGSVPGLPHGYGADWSQRITWIEARLATQRDVFKGRNNFLEQEVGAPDAAEQLSNVLGLSLPWWGREIVNSKRNRQQVA